MSFARGLHGFCAETLPSSLGQLYVLFEEGQSRVLTYLPYSSLTSLALCSKMVRSVVRDDVELWESRLVTVLPDDDALSGCQDAPLELVHIIHRSEVDASRRARRIDVDGQQLVCEALLSCLPETRRPLFNGKVCPAPTWSDSVASQRARSIAASARLRCSMFAPYLVYMSEQAPPTLRQIHNFIGQGLCQAHSWYKKLPFDRGEPFWVFLSPVPRAFGPEYHNEYGLLDWRHPSEGPPRDVETPSGQRLVVPPGVSSGRDARVYLSASCGVRGSLTDLTLSQRLREPQPQSERRHMRILLAQEEQCANEQVAVFEAIVRQCRVIYGQHWQAS